MENLCNVTTGEVRMSYVHLFKPYAAQPGQEERYSVTILIPKTDKDTMGRIDAAIEAAEQRGINEKWNGQCPPVIPMPVYDGDGVRPSDGTPFGAECRGHWVLTAGSGVDNPPEVVDATGNPVINQSEIYSGIYGRVNLTFYPYNSAGRRGIGCGKGLNCVQKLHDGEPLSSGRVSASQAFGAPQPAPASAAAPATSYASGFPGYAQPSVQPGYSNTPQGMPQTQPSGGINPITGMPY
nr:DUF2815 family protein [Enterocloster clostridioformis]